MRSVLSSKSLCEVSRLLRAGEVSAVELVQAVAQSIEAFQPRLNAYISLYTEKALDTARSYQKGVSTLCEEKPLFGIPVALKDLYYTKGRLTTAGSKILANFVPSEDSEVWRRLEAAGAILIGKTNTHEYAYGPSNENSFYGPVRNPWNPERISGGSSGGSGAAVAANMAYMAMGTDTGGSIRIPAALCGVVGFKPTHGAVSTDGIIPLSPSFDHPGPMARCVDDIALVMDVIHDRDAKGVKPDYLGVLEADESLKGVRIGVPQNHFWEKTDYDVEASVRKAIEDLRSLGAEIVEVCVPGAEEAQRITTVLMSLEAYAYHEERLLTRGEDYQPDVRERLLAAAKITPSEHACALRRQAEIRADVKKMFEGIDALVFPSVPVLAYPIGSSVVTTRNKTENAREMLTRHTRLGNLTGGPALGVPCGLSPEGLPCGLQILGDPGADAKVLSIGRAYEKTRAWDGPPLG